jgi:hypothetical protein
MTGFALFFRTDNLNLGEHLLPNFPPSEKCKKTITKFFHRLQKIENKIKMKKLLNQALAANPKCMFFYCEYNDDRQPIKKKISHYFLRPSSCAWLFISRRIAFKSTSFPWQLYLEWDAKSIFRTYRNKHVFVLRI